MGPATWGLAQIVIAKLDAVLLLKVHAETLPLVSQQYVEETMELAFQA